MTDKISMAAGTTLKCYELMYRPHIIVVIFSHSVVSDSFVTPWTVAHQAPLFMGFFRQEHWSGLPFLSPGDLPDSGIKHLSPPLAEGFFTTEPPGKPSHIITRKMRFPELSRKPCLRHPTSLLAFKPVNLFCVLICYFCGLDKRNFSSMLPEFQAE